MLQYVGDNTRQFTTAYGNVSAASIGTILRAVLELEQQGGEQFFGEPMLDIDDLIQTDSKGRGVVNVLVADELVRQPKLYATLLLWLMSELFERLPEIGDPEKPTLVFFFDEAHLLFTDAPAALVDKVEQVVRLIRSKGVGVYFVTQNPSDVPESVLGQLGNRVQHALRAFTPHDQKAVKTAAQTLRQNPKLNIEQAITELGVGEALVSTLDVKARRRSRHGVDGGAVLSNRPDCRRRSRSHPQGRPGPIRALRAGSRSRVGVREVEEPNAIEGRRRGSDADDVRATAGIERRDRRLRVGGHADGSALRHNRSARGTSRRTPRLCGQERRACRRIECRTGDHSRRARFDPRRSLALTPRSRRPSQLDSPVNHEGTKSTTKKSVLVSARP
jgi:hypothetical protein